MAPRKNHYKKLQELERQIDEYEGYSSIEQLQEMCPSWESWRNYRDYLEEKIKENKKTYSFHGHIPC